MLAASINDVYKENHLQIAEYLKVNYRHLLKNKKKFKEEKKISKKGSEYILDREKLKQLIKEKNN